MMVKTKLRNGDVLSLDGSRVTVERKDGRSIMIASYDNAHHDHRRGAFVVGGVACYHLPKETEVRVLKIFYPEETLSYLRKHGYIAFG